MKKLYTLTFLFISIIANAQTETVAPKSKKLQQLYLSVGTGPAITTNKDSNPLGGIYLLNFTGAFGPTSIFRLNFQHAVFTNYRAATPGLFRYLDQNSYYSTFIPANESTTISFSYGKKKQLNKLIQVQALAGAGLNIVSKFDWGPSNSGINPDFTMGPCIPEVYYLPGALIQTEAMFLPSKFAGLTAGAYLNLTPKLPSAGINLSLNLGMLK